MAKLALGRKVEKKGVKGDREFGQLVDQLKLDEAIGWVFEKYIDRANLVLNQQTPWKLEVNDPKRSEVLADCIFNIVTAAYYLKAIMPETCGKIIEIFSNDYQPIEKPLFPRIS